MGRRAGPGGAPQHRREAVGKEEKRFPPPKNKSVTANTQAMGYFQGSGQKGQARGKRSSIAGIGLTKKKTAVTP